MEQQPPQKVDAVIEGVPCVYLDWHTEQFERIRHLISMHLTGSFSILAPIRVDFYEPLRVPDKYAPTLFAVVSYDSYEGQLIMVVPDIMQNLALSKH